MAMIRVSHVQPDQEISADVKDRSGRVLLLAGTVLTEKHIKIIKSWGVVEIDVVGPDLVAESGQNIAEDSSDKFREVELEVSKRFRFLNRAHPFTEELYSVCLQRELYKRGLVNGD